MLKMLLTTGLLLILGGKLHAQTSSIDSLKTYIKTEGYVPITKKGRLPKAIMPYYNIIVDSINRYSPEMKHWYVRLGTFENNSDYIGFGLYPLAAIVFIKKHEDIRKITDAENDRINRDTSIKIKTQIIDDYGGSAGEVGVSYYKKKHKLKIISFE